MSLESASYPNQLVATNPPFDDPKAQGDDHIRLIKNVLTITFANVAGVVGLAVNTSGNHTWTGTHNFTTASYVSLPAVSTVATTPVITSNSTQVATTAFVQSVFGATTQALGFRSRAFFYGGNK